VTSIPRAQPDDSAADLEKARGDANGIRLVADQDQPFHRRQELVGARSSRNHAFSCLALQILKILGELVELFFGIQPAGLVSAVRPAKAATPTIPLFEPINLFLGLPEFHRLAPTTNLMTSSAADLEKARGDAKQLRSDLDKLLFEPINLFLGLPEFHRLAPTTNLMTSSAADLEKARGDAKQLRSDLDKLRTPMCAWYGCHSLLGGVGCPRIASFPTGCIASTAAAQTDLARQLAWSSLISPTRR